MDMRMVGHGRAPGVEHGGQADARAQMLRIGGDGLQRLGGGLEQEVVDHGLVLEGDGGDLPWQGEDDVIVGDRQQAGLPLGEPGLGRLALALGAVAVAAGVVGDRQMGAVVAARDMAAHLGGAAGFDGRHDLELIKAQASGVGGAEGLAMGAQDVGHLQGWPRHVSRLRPRAASAARAGSSPRPGS